MNCTSIMRLMTSVSMWDASYRICAGMHKRRGSTPSATRGCQTSRLGLVRAGTQLVSITYNSAPGKVILDQSVKALPVRCSAYVTGQLQHARCGRKSVATAEEALVTSLERGKSRFPQLGVWLNRRKL